MREVIMNEIIELATNDNTIFVLDCDCSCSTKSFLFQEKFPNRFINVGIAEQNMIGVATGLALMNQRVIVNGFANMLCLRAYDFIYQLIARQNLKITILGHYAGVSSGKEGGTHHALNTINIMDSIPRMRVFSPYDDQSAKECINEAVRYNGSCYINVSKTSYEFDRTNIIKQGGVEIFLSNSKILIVTTGVISSEILAAQEILMKKGVGIDICLVSDITNATVVISKVILPRHLMILVVEEEFIPGRLYLKTCEAITKSSYKPLVLLLGISDFTRSGNQNEIWRINGIYRDGIVKLVADFEMENYK